MPPSFRRLARRNVGFQCLQLLIRERIHRRNHVIRRRDNRHILADGILNIVLEFLVEHLALFNGQFAFFDQFIQHIRALFLRHRRDPDARQNQLPQIFAQIQHSQRSLHIRQIGGLLAF